jgi:hypothetical protein
MDPMLTAPGTKRLKLNHDKLLSNLIIFAFKQVRLQSGRPRAGGCTTTARQGLSDVARLVTGCHLTPETRVHSAFYDVAGNGPGRNRSLHHRLPFTSSNEGSKRVSITWWAMYDRPYFKDDSTGLDESYLQIWPG